MRSEGCTATITSPLILSNEGTADFKLTWKVKERSKFTKKKKYVVISENLAEFIRTVRNQNKMAPEYILDMTEYVFYEN